jgi:hypothetical protein
MSPRRSRIPFEQDYAPAPELVVVDEAVDQAVDAIPRAYARPPRPLPPRVAPPLSTLELAWSLGDEWLEPYFAVAIDRHGGFRPILARAFGAPP